tara:strand:+ start:193 stop:1179 length:987 start_codon:yes stop_codon:yes gene_type:complete
MAAKQNKLSEAEEIQKKATTKQVVGGVNTQISLTKTEKEFYQRFVNLSVNEMPLPQGDGMIRISPFDDYFLFTLYDEIDGEDTPIDLSNVGTLYLNFIGETDDIDIKNHTQVEEVDLAQGEVLFRITRSDSKKILALSNNNFYISTKMIDPEDGSTSDESVLYQGIWLAVDDANRISLTREIEELRVEYSILLANFQDEITRIQKENNDLITSAEEDNTVIIALQNSNDEMTDEIAELTKDLKSSKLTAIYERSKAAAAAARIQILKKQQIRAIQESAKVAQTKSKKKFYYKNAAKNLQNFTIGRNRSTPRDFKDFKDNLFGRNRNYE